MANGKVFEKLSAEEIEFLKDVPVLASILVAGADNQIDIDEKKVAHELAHIKSYTSIEEFQCFFKEVSDVFQERFDALVAKYPATAKERNPQIRKDLKEVQTILKKMDGIYAEEFIDSIEEMSRYIAEASGGVLGYMAISRVEQRALHNLTIILNAY